MFASHVKVMKSGVSHDSPCWYLVLRKLTKSRILESPSPCFSFLATGYLPRCFSTCNGIAKNESMFSSYPYIL